MADSAVPISIQIRQAASDEEVVAITAAIVALLEDEPPVEPVPIARPVSRWARAGRLEALQREPRHSNPPGG